MHRSAVVKVEVLFPCPVVKPDPHVVSWDDPSWEMEGTTQTAPGTATDNPSSPDGWTEDRWGNSDWSEPSFKQPHSNSKMSDSNSKRAHSGSKKTHPGSKKDESKDGTTAQDSDDWGNWGWN